MASHVVGGSAMPVQCGLFCGVFGFLKYILTLVITAAVASQVVGGTASSVQCGLYALYCGMWCVVYALYSLYSVQTRAAVASQVVGGTAMPVQCGFDFGFWIED